MHPRAAKKRYEALKQAFREQSYDLTYRITTESNPAQRMLLHVEHEALVDRFVLEINKVIPLLPVSKKGIRGSASAKGAEAGNSKTSINL